MSEKPTSDAPRVPCPTCVGSDPDDCLSCHGASTIDARLGAVLELVKEGRQVERLAVRDAHPIFDWIERLARERWG